MSRILAVLTGVAVCGVFSGCDMLPGMGGGGGGGSYTPTEVPNSMYQGDLNDAKEGRWMTYASEAGGSKTSTTVKVVGKDGDNYWVEYWMDLGSMAYGYLFVVGKDKKITKAWAAPKDGKEWKEIKVTEPPKGAAGDAPKPTIKESDEKKEVKAGSFQSHKMDVTVNIGGKDYNSQSWFSKDVWKLYTGSEHGGLVAMEASGSKTQLDSKGEDGKPTIELPKK
ncbi:MAG TPA: hypothetical protein VE981_10420 [Planctomycetota bacterium]|nr:hypothetical protein [Planctomycetota bacterium]